MSRYIDADKFIRWIDVGHLRSPSEICYCEDDVKGMIDMQPTADVVEVIRCKDCVFCTRTKDGEYNPEDIVCGYFMTDGMQANDFCSYGKRREETK